MKKRGVFILVTLLSNGWFQSARAVELSAVCGFKKDQLTKFSTNLATRSDQNFGSYSSGLDIIRSGAKLDGWQPIWCYGQPLNTADQVRPDGFFKFTVMSIGNHSGLALTNNDQSGDTIPIKVCIGTKGSTMQGYCATETGAQITIPMDTPENVTNFRNAVLPVEDNWKNPNPDFLFVKFNWRIASHVEIPPHTNPSPGIYSGLVNLAMSVRFKGSLFGSSFFAGDVDGDSMFSTTYEVFIHKDCEFQTPSSINFGTGSFVKELATAKGQLTVQCTKNTPYRIKMSGKYDKNGDHDQHYMVDKKGDHIPYQLYNSDGTTLWQYDNPKEFHGTGNTDSIDILAKVNSGATEVSAGEYSDIITAELIY